MKNTQKEIDLARLLASYPRKHPALPEEYKRIYVQHYRENRNGETKASAAARKFERWIHEKVAKSARGGEERKHWKLVPER